MDGRLLGAAAGAAASALAGAALAAAAPRYAVVDRIPGPDGGWDYVRVDDSGNRVLVTRGGSVMAVDLRSKQVAAGLASGERLHLAMPVDGGTEVVVTEGGADKAVFYDAKSWKPVATVATGKGPDGGTIDPRTGLVLVVNHAGGTITLVDPKRHAVAGEIAVGGTLEEAAADGEGKAFVNVEDRNEIAAIDLAQRKVLARYPLSGCDGPTGLAYDAADKLLIAACDGATDLVSTATGKVVQTLPTGAGADGVVFDARRKLAFVPAGRDGTLSVVVIEGGRGRIVQTLQTAKSARTIGLDARSGRLYLPSAQQGPAEPNRRPAAAPGSFRLLVVAPQ
jgi:DNA-binding beta-propeller fold protein YncE